MSEDPYQHLYPYFDQEPSLCVRKKSPQATIPTRDSGVAAGLHLHAAETKTIPPGKRANVDTGLVIFCPPGTYARIAPRDDLTLHSGIIVGAGVVDADYRGNVGVILFNLGDSDFQVRTGDRIAQLILERITLPRSVIPLPSPEEFDQLMAAEAAADETHHEDEEPGPADKENTSSGSKRPRDSPAT